MGRGGMAGEFWLSDRAWAAIAPLLPTNQPGARRVDDRRVISGIIHALRSGCRRKDCPAVYGPPTTICNRFNRWSRKGLWGGSSRSWPPGRSRRRISASIPPRFGRIARPMAAKGGEGSGRRALARRADPENPCPERWTRTDRRLPAHAGQCRGHLGSGGVARGPARAAPPDRRQRL